MAVSARRVSVVVPTRDRPVMLAQALQSIRALESDDLTFEIVVGDNGALPETRRVAEAFGAIHVAVDRAGAGAARNAAMEAATCEFIAFLDDDDVWLGGAVRAQLALLDGDAGLEAVVGQVVCTDEELRPTTAPWPSEHPGGGDKLVEAMLSGYYPQIGATLARASAARQVGRFDESLMGDQDWDWQLRLARRRKLGFVAEQCVLFRQRPAISFDSLRFSRLGCARRVFFRHALAEWRIWRNPGELARAYRGALWQYYEYFNEAAVTRARAGDRASAARAMWGAFRTFPLRAAFHLVAPKPLRRAMVISLSGKPG
jgi:glycosyltransferase involved in cell wall biosynthesis